MHAPSSLARPDFQPDIAAIATVIFGVSAFAVAQGLTYPLIALVLESQGVSPLLSGLNAGCFALGLALATFAVGALTRLVRGDRLIVLSLGGCAVSLTLFASSHALPLWFLARFSLGFCASLVFVLSEAWLNAACPDRLRGRVSGLYGMGLCGGFAAGPLAIPLFGKNDAFAFALLAVYVAMVAVVSVILSRRARTQPEQVASGQLLAFFPMAPVLTAMVAAFAFADIAAISTMPSYFVRIGFSESFAAVSVSVLALPTAIAQPLVGWLLDRTSRNAVALLSGLLAGSSFVAIPFLQSEIAILAAFAVLGAASFSLYTCALTLLGDRFTGGDLVAGSAAFALAYAAGSAGGSSATGYAMQAISPAAGPISAGSVLLAFTLFMLLRRIFHGRIH